MIAALLEPIGIIWIYEENGFTEDTEIMIEAQVEVLAIVECLLVFNYAYPFNYIFYLVTSEI